MFPFKSEDWQKFTSQFEGGQAEEVPSILGKVNLLAPFRPSTDGMRSTYLLKGSVLYSKSSNENVNLSQHTENLDSMSAPIQCSILLCLSPFMNMHVPLA